jgi:hypothetical protein
MSSVCSFGCDIEVLKNLLINSILASKKLGISEFTFSTELIHKFPQIKDYIEHKLGEKIIYCGIGPAQYYSMDISRI